MLAIAIRRRHDLPFGLALAGTVVSFLALWPASDVGPRRVTLLFIIDGYALFYVGLILVATIFVFLLSYGYLKTRREPQDEFYLLVLLATLGATECHRPLLLFADHIICGSSWACRRLRPRTLAALALILIWLGVYPPRLIALIRLTALQVGN